MKKRILIISYNNATNSKLITWLGVQPQIQKVLDTTWLIATTEEAKDFFAKIEPLLDKDNDRVFVSEIITDSRQGWLSRSIWEWITETLK